MNHDKKILTIDQSTSGTKVLIINADGQIVHRCTEDHRQFYPQPDWVEHDPIEIWEKTQTAIRRVLTESNTNVQCIAAVAITNQRETVVVWDRKTGQPVYNAVVWQCQRGAQICKELREAGYNAMVEEKTGLLIDPYFSATGIKWILDNVKGTREKAAAGDLVFGTIDTWLIYNLTGKQVIATDYSNACRTMLLNIYDLTWDKDLLQLLDIPFSMAPDVLFSDAAFGYTDVGNLFEREIPITGVMGDSHAALFGQNCFEPGMAKATFGTGSSIMMNIGKQPQKSPQGLVTSIGWGSNSIVSYVFEGNIHCTGDTINWLVNDLKLLANAAESEQLAFSVPDNNSVFLVPAFAGLGAPYWENRARASISGMPRSTKRAHIVRAALEAIAYQVRDLIDLMTQNSGLILKELRVDGGPTRNAFLMQFLADMVNGKIIRTRAEEISALGVAFMAGLTVGIWKDLNELQTMRQVDREFKPVMADDQRQQLYNGWQRAVQSVLNAAKGSSLSKEYKL